jgi:hypothetical protein
VAFQRHAARAALAPTDRGGNFQPEQWPGSTGHPTTMTIPPAVPDPSAGAEDLPPLPTAPLGRYRHYKGGVYDVIGVARHSETLEPMVVYRPLYGATGLWVRPYAMFFEHIEVDGRSQPRFAPVPAALGSGEGG